MRISKEEILTSLLTRLRSQNGITETSPGSIARTFCEVITEEIDPIYSKLDLATAMSYVSSASGAYLDLVAELVNCKRNVNESDENFKARITNQTTLLQSANLISLRLKALQIDGIADVQFQRFTHGAGSFTCYITPQVYPITNNILLEAEVVLDEAAAYGMYVDVKISEYKPVDLLINLIFHSKTTSLEREYIRNQVVSNVTVYMKQLNMGSAIIINEIIQRVMETSNQILDMEIKELRIAERSYFIKNIEPSTDERFFLRKITVT